MMLCNHGFYLTHCALCLKRKGECDYGSCVAAATTIVRGTHEGRHACDKHAPIIVVAGA